MPESLVKRLRIKACLLLLVSGYGLAFSADISFSRINACNEIEALLQITRQTPAACVRPKSVSDRTVRSYLSSPKLEVCFLEQPPLRSLSDFNCLHVTMGEHRSVNCYRPATLSKISEFKSGVDSRYSAQVSRYLSEARVCPGTNGDASRVIDTTFPPALMPIAVNEFGFNVQYGTTRPGRSLISHGFARTSPDVSRSGMEAIEYFVVSDGMTPSSSLDRTAHGEWRLRIDTSTDFIDPLIRQMRKQGIDFFPAVVDIDMTRAPLAPLLPGNAKFSAELAAEVVSTLEDEGFEELSDQALRRSTGKSREQIVETFKEGAAFGARKLLENTTTTLRVLMKTTGSRCTRNEDGVFAAYLISFSGERGVAVDFGSVGVFVLGLGACGSRRTEGRSYVSNLTRDIQEQLLSELSSR